MAGICSRCLRPDPVPRHNKEPFALSRDSKKTKASNDAVRRAIDRRNSWAYFYECWFHSIPLLLMLVDRCYHTTAVKYCIGCISSAFLFTFFSVSAPLSVGYRSLIGNEMFGI